MKKIMLFSAVLVLFADFCVRSKYRLVLGEQYKFIRQTQVAFNEILQMNSSSGAHVLPWTPHSRSRSRHRCSQNLINGECTDTQILSFKRHKSKLRTTDGHTNSKPHPFYYYFIIVVPIFRLFIFFYNCYTGYKSTQVQN